MLTKRFHLHTALLGSTQFNQLQQVTYSDGVSVYRDEGSGIADSVFTYVSFIAPRIEFTTTALKRALDAIGFNGVHVTTGATPLSLIFQQAAQGGVRQSGSTAMRINFAAGMAVPTRISAAQKQPATVSILGMARSTDGTTAPFTKQTAQALPSLTAGDQGYTVGPVKINNSMIGGVQSTEVDFGIQPNIDADSGSSDGEAYNTFIYILKRQSRITIRTQHVDALTTGFAAITSATTIFFRKCAQGGVRVADATAEHIAVTVTAGTIYTEQVQGDNGLELQITIEPHFDGTNDALQVSTGSAIA